MPKQILKIADFSGGLNTSKDPKDIEDNQFSAAFNVRTDKQGVVGIPGGGLQEKGNLPHTNTNYQFGSGLYNFSHDYSYNILDSDFNIGIEEGTIHTYTSQTSFILEDTSTVSGKNDYYNYMTILIYSGTGAGRARQITDYVGSTRTITCDDFGTALHDKDDGSPSKYRIYRWGPDGTGTNAFGDQADANWITDGNTSGFPSGIDSVGTENKSNLYLRSKTATITDESFKSLGWIEYWGSSNSSSTYYKHYLNRLVLKPGVQYTFSFDCAMERILHNHVADGANDGSKSLCDQPPWFYLYNATLNLGLYADGESAKLYTTNSSNYPYSSLQSNYIDNGDFQDGVPSNNGTANGWTEVDSGGTLATSQCAADSAYGTHDGTVEMSQAVAAAKSPTISYIYQQISLDDNTPFHLTFVYASTDGMKYSVYDATASQSIIPWTNLPSTGGATTYKYVNEIQDDFNINNKKRFKHVHFETPDNSGTNRNIQIRFAPIGPGTTVRLAGVVLRKAVVDLVSMSYNGGGANPFLDNGIVNTWNTYTCKFRIPSDVAERDDWVLKLFGGIATYRANATDASNTQTVYMDNIKLSGEDNANITLMSNNLSSYSKIMVYDDNSKNWNGKEIIWPETSSRPVYNYINGMLKISDSNFATNNQNFLIYQYSRELMSLYNSHGWKIQNYSLPHAPNVSVTTETTDGVSGTIYDGITYINALYSNLEYRNASVDEVDSWSDGRKTNWDMDDIKGFGILQMYLRETEDDDYSTVAGVFGGINAGIKAGESVEHATIRGISHNGASDGNAQTINIGEHNPISLWISGSDSVNSSINMSTLASGAGNVAKIVLNFSYEFQTYRQVGSEYDKSVANNKLPYFEVKAWKVDTSEGDIQVGGTSLVSGYNGDVTEINLPYKQIAADTSFQNGENNQILDYFPVAQRRDENGDLVLDEDGNPIDILKVYEPAKEDFNTERTFLSEDNIQNMIVEDGIGETGAEQHILKGSNNIEQIITFTEDDAITTSDDIMVTIELKGIGRGTTSRFNKSFGAKAENPFTNTDGQSNGTPTCDLRDTHEGAARWARFKINQFDVHFFEAAYDSSTQVDQINIDDNTQVNFNFGTPDGVDASGWGESIFKIATSSVNIFDEESSLNSNQNFQIGASSTTAGTITLGHCPTITVYIANSIMKDPFIKKTKFYMKNIESDIWYLQFYVDHETGFIHSTTSNKKEESVDILANECKMWTMQREYMTNFNEVDSYEAETGVSQENAVKVNNALLTCRYKTSVVANNRLYVGNIKQNGVVYGDRMIKSPIGKYNVLPSTNFIDVAVNDGDEITALEFYKDKLLQFKKRKVFVINTSGDYEFLEDTFNDIGVDYQFQVTKTPAGIVWVNRSGCFLYNGQQINNLIDNKLSSEASGNAPGIKATTTKSWWVDEDSLLYNQTQMIHSYPSVGYDAPSKTIIVVRDITGGSTGTSGQSLTGFADSYYYSLVTQTWYFGHKRIWDLDTPTLTNSTALSNFSNDKNGSLIYYVHLNQNGERTINKWHNKPKTSTDSNIDYFTFITKDYDFGNPSVRKKIYKVYVTFRSVDNSNDDETVSSTTDSYQDSKILVKYSVDGGSAQTFSDSKSTNYSASAGLNGSGTGWITAVLVPSSSINNIYSFKLSFEGVNVGSLGSGGIPNHFEINDFSIVYKTKPIK